MRSRRPGGRLIPEANHAVREVSGWLRQQASALGVAAG